MSTEAQVNELVAKELVFKRDLESFCKLLNENQIPFLIWKGAVLAYTLYPAPHLRPRIDADILISERHRRIVFDILMANGYTAQVNQQDLLGQMSFVKKINQLSAIYDVHWQVFAQQSLKSLFSFEELWRERKSLSHVAAYTVSDEMALILASVHWVAHHFSYPEPHWIEDIQLLSAHRSPAWWQKVKQLCEDKNIRHIVHETLQRAQVQSPWQGEKLCDEPLQYLLSPTRTPYNDFFEDWRGTGLLERFKILGAHLFPRADYIRQKYQIRFTWTLPFFYIFRIFTGLTKSFKLR
jgi:hypothetical protein